MKSDSDYSKTLPEIPDFSPFSIARLRYEQACEEHSKLVASGLGFVELIVKADAAVRFQNELVGTPAESLNDVALKITFTLTFLDELGEYESVPLLLRSLTAIGSRSGAVARSLLQKALTGETENHWAYAPIHAAIADLDALV